jgi:hypothetical protein
MFGFGIILGLICRAENTFKMHHGFNLLKNKQGLSQTLLQFIFFAKTG